MACHGIPVEGLDFSDQKQAVPSADCLRGKQVGDITRIVGRAAEKVRFRFFGCFSIIVLSQRRFFRSREKDRKELRKEKLQTLPEASFQIHGIYSVVPRFATNLVKECFLNVSTNCLNSKMCFRTVIHWTYFLRKTTTISQWWADMFLIGGCCVWIQFAQRIAFSIVVRCTFDFNKFDFSVPKGLKISTLQISSRSHQSQDRQDRQGSSHLKIFEFFLWQVGISRSGNSDRAFGISRFKPRRKPAALRRNVVDLPFARLLTLHILGFRAARLCSKKEMWDVFKEYLMIVQPGRGAAQGSAFWLRRASVLCILGRRQNDQMADETCFQAHKTLNPKT